MLRRRPTAVPVIVLMSLVLALSQPGTRAAAAATDVATGTAFNNPRGTTAEQNTILDHLAHLIEGAVPGSTIELSVMDFGSVWLEGLLNDAKNRGVTVQIIIASVSETNTNGGPVYTDHLTKDFTRYSASDGPAASWYLVCSGPCLAKDTDPAESTYTGVDHNKFYLFSSTTGIANDVTDPVSDVIVQTSANLTDWDLHTAYNDAVTVAGNTALYNAYGSYFGQLRDSGSGTRPKQANGPDAVQAGNFRIYFFPRNDNADDDTDDTIVNILDAVDDPIGTNAICAGNSAGFGNSSGHTLIQIAMHQITRLAVAQKLWNLQNDGCDVRIVYAQLDAGASTPICDQLVKSTAHGRIPLKQLTGAYVVHDKYMLIDGGYNGVANQKIVFTGSETYTSSALHANDEVLLKYADPTGAIFDPFQAHFQTVDTDGNATSTTSC